MVIFSHGSFTFKDLDCDSRLIILICSKDLTFFVGIIDPLSIILLITPPTVSIPRDKGVASTMTNPSVSLLFSPQIIPP